MLRSYKDTPHGWSGWIRTSVMQESKSCALPLGDTPSVMQNASRNDWHLLNKRENGGVRTHGIQSHNLALYH